MEHVDDYKEAKRVIINSLDSDLEKKRMRTLKLRSIFTTAAAVGTAVSVGIITQDPSWGMVALPVAATAGMPLILPYFAQKTTNKRIENGDFFVGKDESTVIKIANDYVDEVNREEQKGMSR